MRHFNPISDQAIRSSRSSIMVPKFLDIEAGIGFGLTDASDKLQLKLILSRDLNKR